MMKKILIALVVMFVVLSPAYAMAGEVQSSVSSEEDGFPISEHLSEFVSEEVQRYVYSLACARGLGEKETLVYYATLVGLMDGESEFNTKAYNGKSCDRGLFQVNRIWVDDFQKMGWINCADDLYDPFISARCGEYIFWDGHRKYGYSEDSYALYLYGRKHSSTKYTRRGWKMMQNWVNEYLEGNG